MVNSEYSLDNYKSFKISISATIKNPEMLKFILHQLKIKMMCKTAVKNCCL